MTNQLILNDPITRINQAIDEFPPKREIPDGETRTAPDGHSYVPILPPPPYDPELQKLVQDSTLTYDGWKAVDLSLDERKAIEINKVEQTFVKDLEVGVSAGGMTLGGLQTAQVAFTNMLVQMREEEELGFPPGDALIIDVNGKTFPLPASMARQVLVSYRKAVQLLQDQAALDREAIQDANSLTKLDKTLTRLKEATKR